ncbi:hypothetical protein BJX64DRAFT_295411 [Aspergillus heterothallicus]
MIDSFSPSYFTSAGLSSLYIPSHKNETASQPMDESGSHPNLAIRPSFLDIYITHPNNDIIMTTLPSIEPDLYHIAPAPLSAFPASAAPTESNHGPATGSQAINGQSTHKGRRYRERRNKQTKSLEQIVTDLETKFQLLSNDFYQKSHEVIQIFRDKNLLRSEGPGLPPALAAHDHTAAAAEGVAKFVAILEEDFEYVNDGLAPPIKAASLDGLLRSLGVVLSAND